MPIPNYRSLCWSKSPRKPRTQPGREITSNFADTSREEKQAQKARGRQAAKTQTNGRQPQKGPSPGKRGRGRALLELKGTHTDHPRGGQRPKPRGFKTSVAKATGGPPRAPALEHQALRHPASRYQTSVAQARGSPPRASALSASRSEAQASRYKPQWHQPFRLGAPHWHWLSMHCKSADANRQDGA